MKSEDVNEPPDLVAGRTPATWSEPLPSDSSYVHRRSDGLFLPNCFMCRFYAQFYLTCGNHCFFFTVTAERGSANRKIGAKELKNKVKVAELQVYGLILTKLFQNLDYFLFSYKTVNYPTTLILVFHVESIWEVKEVVKATIKVQFVRNRSFGADLIYDSKDSVFDDLETFLQIGTSAYNHLLKSISHPSFLHSFLFHFLQLIWVWIVVASE